MDKIKGDSALSIWKNILLKVAEKEAIDLSVYSRANRTPIPRETGHRFHFIPDTDSI
jgi:hypothetical protein